MIKSSFTERTEKAQGFMEVLEGFMFIEYAVEHYVHFPVNQTPSQSSPCTSLQLRATPCSFPSVFLTYT